MNGFSLLEIMVTIAIISIMAGSVVIGFNSFGQTVRVQETAGVIQDIIKNRELDMIRRDYTKQTLHFEENYIVIESNVENQSLNLEWNGQGGCQAGEEELSIDNTDPKPIYLAQRDQYENNLQITPVPPNTLETVCVAFQDAEETEWQYQVFEGGRVSPVIRFIHFNIRRGDPETVTIENNNYRLEINAPYGSKAFYENGTLVTGPVELTIENDTREETITLQE